MDVTRANGAVLNGAYRLDALLGRGGMGAVYQAIQLSVRRPVAVKLVDLDAVSESMQPMLLRRFEREALATSRLSHPNTVRLYDFGVADGTPFLVLELLVGESLRTRLDRSRALASADVVAIIGQIASSLTEAHGLGIIHRDLKPDNVFMTRISGLPDVVKVMDFGIASWREETTNITGQQVLGTVRYMAPEQFMATTPTPATDIYALGIMTFEMLTGATPFQGRPEAIMGQHLTCERPALPPLLEPHWGPLLDRMLAKEPAERFQETTSLLDALDARRAMLATLPVPNDLTGDLRTGRVGKSGTFLPGARTNAERPRFADATGMATGDGPKRARTRAWAIPALAIIVGGGLAALAASSQNPESPAANDVALAPTRHALVGMVSGVTEAEVVTTPSAETRHDSYDTNHGGADSDIAPLEAAPAGAPEVVAADASPKDPGKLDTKEPAPTTFAIHLESYPSAARITIRTPGGPRELCARTPCEVTLPMGSETLRLSANLAGYLPATLEIPANGNAASTATFKLRKKPKEPPPSFELPP